MFFPVIMSQCKTCDPRGGTRHNLNKLGRGPLGDDLHTKYQGSRPRRYFHVFLYVSLCKICDPLAGHFSPQRHNLNKLGRGPLGDATYQIHVSRLYAL